MSTRLPSAVVEPLEARIAPASAFVIYTDIGGDFVDSAGIDSDAGITGVIVGGSIIGSGGASIESVGQIGKIEVRGSAALSELKVTAGGLGKLVVGGRLFVNSLNLQGALGSMKAGSLGGNFTVAGDVGAVQIARDFTAVFTAASLMKSLVIGGDFSGNFNALELSSVSIKGSTFGSLNATTLGTVKVGGDWIASNLVAGVKDTNGDDDVVNLPPGAEADAIIAKIASITIGGTLAGTPLGTDRFGFVAQQIGSFKASGFAAPLTSGTDAPISLSPTTADVTLREI